MARPPGRQQETRSSGPVDAWLPCRGTGCRRSSAGLEGLDLGGQSRLGAGGGVWVDDVSGAGPVELFGGQVELGLGQFGVAGLDGLTDLAALGADDPLDRAVSQPVGNVLAESLFGTRGSGPRALEVCSFSGGLLASYSEGPVGGRCGGRSGILA